MGFTISQRCPLPREVNSRSRAHPICLIFERDFKNKDLSHIFSAVRSAEKISLPKKFFSADISGVA
jgi:hypothetical protein